MAITLSKDELVKIYVLVTGESERVFENVFTDAQAIAIASAISEAVSSASDLVTTDQIIAAAAAMAPGTVFAGVAGIAKLVAWAVADSLAAIAVGTGGLAKIKAYVAANAAVMVADSAVHLALEAAGWHHA